MPSGLPCPNPTCTHVFTPESIKGPGALKCPRCGSVFDFRKTAPPPSKPVALTGRPTPVPPSRPPAKAEPRPAAVKAAPPPTPVIPPLPPPPVPQAPPAAIPMAMPAEPVAIPMAMPVGGEMVPMAMPYGMPPPPQPPSPDLIFNADQKTTVALNEAYRPRKKRPLRLVLVVVLALAGTGGALFGAFKLFLLATSNLGNTIKGQLAEFNCDLTPPDGWKQDKGRQDQFNVVYALRKKNPHSFCCLEIENHKEGFPSKSILIETFKDRVGKVIRDMAWQPRGGSIDRFDKVGTLGKQPAYVLEFAGEYDSTQYAGECHIVEYRGFVYWLICFAPEASGDEQEALQKEWADLRDKFVLLDQREGWKPIPRKTNTASGDGWQLSYPVDVWKKPDKVENPDADSKLLIQGLDPRAEREGEESRAGKTANLNVVVLKKGDDKEAAAKILRDHFLDRQKEIGFGMGKELELTPLKDKDGKELVSELKFGSSKAVIGKYQLTVTGGTGNRFVVLVSIPRSDDTLGLYLDCGYKFRDFWELEMSVLLDGLKLGK